MRVGSDGFLLAQSAQQARFRNHAPEPGGLKRLVPWLAPVLAALIVAGWVWFILDVLPVGSPTFVDWRVYASASAHLMAGEPLFLAEQLAGPYYLPDGAAEGYIYPPASALILLPFSFGDLGLAMWLFGNVAIFITGLVAVVHRELGEVRPLPLALVILGLVVVLPLPGGVFASPFAIGVVSGNVTVALAGLLAWCWAAGERRKWIPYVAGAAAIIKVFPGALALWAARREGWRSVAIAGGVAAVIALGSLPLVGVEQWSAFLTALSNALPTCDPWRTSIACLAQPAMGPTLAKVIGIVAGALLILLAVIVRREYLAFVLLTAGMLAPLANGHQHYLLFAYVLLVIGVCRLAARRRAANPSSAAAL